MAIEMKKSFELPPYITTIMSLLCRLNSKLAAQFAYRLFFQPIAFPIPGREKPMQQKSVVKELQTADGQNFTTYTLGKGSKKVVMIHGWSGRGTQFFKITEALAPHFTITAIDAPAHGKHKGPKTNMLKFVEALEVAETELGPFDYAIGHSLGGMALFNALQRNAAYAKLIIIGSPASIKNVVTDFCKKVKANMKVRDKILARIERQFNLKVEAASLDYLAQKHNPAGLIIHDEDDQDVPVLNARQSARAWPAAELVITRGLGHRRVLMDDEVILKIKNFLNQ